VLQLDATRQRQQHFALVDLDFESGGAQMLRDDFGADFGSDRSGETRLRRQFEQERAGRRRVGRGRRSLNEERESGEQRG